MARIDAYFQYLIESSGSDLHLAEGAPPKVRIHGSISAIPDQSLLEGDDFKNLLAEICDEVVRRANTEVQSVWETTLHEDTHRAI